VVKSALPGHIDDFHAGIPQQRQRLQEAHFHSQGGHRTSKMLVEQPIQMAPAATELVRQVTH
jgi:hypothetical protein